MNIEKIWRGEAGLAMTYWVYGVLGSTLFGIPFRLVNPGSAPAVITVLLFCAYFIWIGVGIWRAADKYEGPKIWTYFSKLFVAGPVAAAAIGIAVAILVPIFSVATQPGKSTVSGQISEPALAASEPAVQDRPQKSSAASAIPLTENRAYESSKLDNVATCTPRVTIKKIKTDYPDLRELDDENVVKAIHELFYSDMPIEEIATQLCITLTPQKTIRPLSTSDLSRYEGCQKEAALAPTDRGVKILVQLCKDKFGQ